MGRELVGQRLRNVRVESRWGDAHAALLYTADRIEPSLAYARDIRRCASRSGVCPIMTGRAAGRRCWRMRRWPVRHRD